VHIEGTSGMVLSMDYPSKLVITPPAGVQLTKSTLTQADAKKFAPDGADFEVQFTSSDAGKKAFTGEIKYAVAKGASTTPVTQQLSFTVDVK
jgi:hypothetical protein